MMTGTARTLAVTVQQFDDLTLAARILIQKVERERVSRAKLEAASLLSGSYPDFARAVEHDKRMTDIAAQALRDVLTAMGGYR